MSGKMIHVTAGLHFGVVSEPWREKSLSRPLCVDETLTSIRVESFGVNAANQRSQRECVRQRNGIICFVELGEMTSDVIDFRPVALLYLVEKC